MLNSQTRRRQRHVSRGALKAKQKLLEHAETIFLITYETAAETEVVVTTRKYFRSVMLFSEMDRPVVFIITPFTVVLPINGHSTSFSPVY